MAQLPVPATAHMPISPDEAKHVLETGVWAEDPALKLVIADTIRAENYAATKSWIMQWPQATALYQSPYIPRYWEGTQIERANVPFFTVATMVESLVPQIINGLFYENPPFIIRNRPGTSYAAARAVGSVIAYQLEDIGFREELRLGVKNAVLFGTGMWKWGWEIYSRKRKRYQRTQAPAVIKGALGARDIQLDPLDEGIEEIVDEEYIDRPAFEHIVNLRHVLLDPGLNKPDIRKAKYLVHRLFLTWNDLDKLRERPGYNIPSKEELLMLFFPPKEEVEAAPSEVTATNPLWDARSAARYEETTEDPFNQPLEVLERWDENRVIVVLQKKLVICNDENPYGAIPFLSVGWWDVPEAFYSMGLAKTVGSEQRLQQGVTNAWLDGVALNLNGVYVRVKGTNVPTQSIRISPGKIVDVEQKDGFTPLDRLPAVPEAPAAIQMSQARAESVSGANELITQGSLGGGGRSSITRTAEGVRALAGGTGSRIQDFVEKLAGQVLVPFLYRAHEMNSALLPMATLKAILDDELQKPYLNADGNPGDHLDLLNARVKFEISAAAKLQAKRAMAQALPIMLQFLMNAPTVQALAVEGKKVKVTEVLRMMYEVSEWKNYNEVIVDMTPEDQQRWAMTLTSAGKAGEAKDKAALQQQQFENKQQLVDQQNIALAGREALRMALKRQAEGEPNEVGFGMQ